METQPRARSRRALVIDDDVGVQRLLSRVLSMHGFEVDRAGDGEQGLRCALSTSYDVVLLDLHLPGIDGITVLRSLLSARPDQTVLVCSCASDPQTRATCLDLGARGVVPKPFGLADLSASLLATVGRTERSLAAG